MQNVGIWWDFSCHLLNFHRHTCPCMVFGEKNHNLEIRSQDLSLLLQVEYSPHSLPVWKMHTFPFTGGLGESQ